MLLSIELWPGRITKKMRISVIIPFRVSQEKRVGQNPRSEGYYPSYHHRVFMTMTMLLAVSLPAAFDALSCTVKIPMRA